MQWKEQKLVRSVSEKNMNVMAENSVKRKGEKERPVWFLSDPFIHLFLLTVGKERSWHMTGSHTSTGVGMNQNLEDPFFFFLNTL